MTVTARTGLSAIAAVEALAGEGFVAEPGIAADRAVNAFGRFPAVDEMRDGLALAAGIAFTGLRTAVFARDAERDAVPAHLSTCAARRTPHVVHLAGTSHGGLESTGRSGVFQLASATHQEAVDFTLIAHRVAELALTPGVHALDRDEISDRVGEIEPVDEATVRAYLGDPDDDISTPTPAQRHLFGAHRRRIPNWFSFDHPSLNGAEPDGITGAAATFARHAFFDEHLPELVRRAIAEFEEHTGRRYEPVSGYRVDDAHVVVITTGVAAARAERVVDHLRNTTRARVGCIKISLVRPFPREDLLRLIDRKKAITVLARTDRSLDEAGLLEREVRATLDTGSAGKKRTALHVGHYGLGGLSLGDADLLAAFENMTARDGGLERFYLGVGIPDASRANPTRQAFIHDVRRDYPDIARRILSPGKAAEDAEREPAAASPVAPDVEPPMAVRRYRDEGPPYSRVSRFWSHGAGKTATVDGPFEAAPVLPPASATFFDCTPIRTALPRFIGSKCTGCGVCFTHCAHSALPPIAIGIESLLRAGAEVAAERGVTITAFTPHFRTLAQHASRIVEPGRSETAGDFLPTAFERLVEKKIEGDRLIALRDEFHAILDALRAFPVAITERFFTRPEEDAKGQGELFSIAVSPQACTGCNACVDVCPEEALVSVSQTEDEVRHLRAGYRLWERLPDTDGETIRRVREDPDFGAIAAVLLSRNYSTTLVGGDGAEPASGERSVVQWVVAIAESLVQPGVLALAGEITSLHDRLVEAVRGGLDAGIPIDDLDALAAALAGGGTKRLDQLLDRVGSSKAVDGDRMARLVDLARSLADLRWALTEGPSGAGRARLGITLSPGPHVAWGRDHPRNPFCFPAVVHWDPTTPHFAAGLCLGHLRHCLDHFRLVRRARLEADGQYDPRACDPEIAALDWRDLTDDEWKAVPPVLLVADAATVVAGGLYRLAAVLGGDAPVKVVLLDSKDDAAGDRPGVLTPALAMLDRNAFVLQASTADPAHLVDGVMEGLRSRRPALLHLHVPRHVASGSPTAVESRTFPCLRFDPDASGAFGLRLSLDANPKIEAGWCLQTLSFRAGESDEDATLTVPITHADWAVADPRFQDHFSPLPPDTDGATPLHEFVALARDARRGRVPFISVVDADRRLVRLRVSPAMAGATEESLAAWTVLQELAGVVSPFTAPLRERLRSEVEREHAAAMAELRAEYEARLAGLETEHAQRTAAVIRERLLHLAGYGATAPEEAPDGGDDGS